MKWALAILIPHSVDNISSNYEASIQYSRTSIPTNTVEIGKQIDIAHHKMVDK